MEFKRWWFFKKNGRPQMNQCPGEFLDALCTRLKTQAFAIKEEIVHPGDYGKSLLIILTGEVMVYRDITEFPVALPDGVTRPDDKWEIVKATDREPLVGFASCLSAEQWSHVCNRTEDWVVHAEKYVDTLYITRSDIIDCFAAAWPEGQKEMVEVAFHHYEVSIDEDGADSPVATGVELVPLEGELGERIDTLNQGLCERVALIESKVDKKLDEIMAALRSGDT